MSIYKQVVTGTTGSHFAITAAANPQFLAFDRQGGLWVPTAKEVQKFQSPLSASSTASVTIPVSNPGDVAADVSRNVYVTQIQIYGTGSMPPQSALLRYAPPYTGKPFATTFGWQLNGVAIYGNEIVVTAYFPFPCNCSSLFYSTLPLTTSSKWTTMNADGQPFAPIFDSHGHLYVPYGQTQGTGNFGIDVFTSLQPSGSPAFAMDAGTFNNGAGYGPAQTAIGP